MAIEGNPTLNHPTTAKEKETPEPVDKYPSLTPLVKKLEKEKEEILKRSEPLRKKRDELVRQIQPLEAKLQEVDKQIVELERPRLPQIGNELGALAKAMGGRSLSEVRA